MTAVRAWPKALAMGAASSLFFSCTFLLNRAMSLAGGDWMWSASLRYLISLPVLFGLCAWKPGSTGRVWQELKRTPAAWLLWSTVGFGLFYAPLTFASACGPSWMAAGVFQLTIMAGALLTPLIPDATGQRQKIPVRLFPAFAGMAVGALLLQLAQIRQSSIYALIFALPVLISAFSYPLGNRKTMQLCGDRLTALERMLAMTVASTPFFLVLAGAAQLRSGWPPVSQTAQAAVVAICAGTLATSMFFRATQLVRASASKLAVVESTQCGEVVFSLLGGVLLLHEPPPDAAGYVGLALITGGMVVNSLLSGK